MYGILTDSDYLWLDKHGDMMIIVWFFSIIIVLVMTYMYKKRQGL